MNIDTSFYDERIRYYLSSTEISLLIPIDNRYHQKYNGFGPIEFTLNLEGVQWILKFWTEAREWFIKKEQERIAREEKKQT